MKLFGIDEQPDGDNADRLFDVIQAELKTPAFRPRSLFTQFGIEVMATTDDPMDDLAQAAEKIASLMRTLTSTGGLRLKYRITAGAGAADPDGFERRDIYVECKGPDAPLLLERDGELLRALEHVAAKSLRLEPEEHDRVSFDAEGFKAARVRHLRRLAPEIEQRQKQAGKHEG